MIVTFPDLGYQLRPYGRGPCWQLYRLHTAQDGDGESWKALDCYPSTVEYGLQLIAERVLRMAPGDGGVAEIVREIRRLQSAMRAVAEALQSRQSPDTDTDGCEVPLDECNR